MAPTVRSFSAVFEPLQLIAQFPESYPGLLESCGAAGRFDILPISTGECLTAWPSGSLSGAHAGSADSFLGALEGWWQSLRKPSASAGASAGASASAAAPLPFSGGWLLYLSYEIAAEIEPRLRLPPSGDAVDALAIRTPAAWIRDRSTGHAWLVAEPDAENLLGLFEDRVRRLPPPPNGKMARFDIVEEHPAKFLTAVSRALEYIAAGEVYQTNLSRQWRASCRESFDPIAIYQRLRSTNPSPFAAILRHGAFCLMSSSPERLLSIRGGIVSTRPIAGTRPRGTSPESDAALVESLLTNEKERAEHVMLIDLERNDLGRVCVGGTVRVDEYMIVESYAHVHHIVSNVSGKLREQASPVDAIRALFPGGTITGCPKIRCMEIIAELEGEGRGAYTGSVGYLNRDGSCDFNILIRTFTAAEPQSGECSVTFRAGAGIVADSIAAQELTETRAKAQGMLLALEYGV